MLQYSSTSPSALASARWSSSLRSAAPGVILSVVGGLHERVATRHLDCVGGMAAG